MWTLVHCKHKVQSLTLNNHRRITMLKLSNWFKSFGNHQVLKDIHLEVPTGDVLTIIGSSGSGKSTLLRSINFLESADKGQIQIDDITQDVQTMKQEDILKIS